MKSLINALGLLTLICVTGASDLTLRHDVHVLANVPQDPRNWTGGSYAAGVLTVSNPEVLAVDQDIAGNQGIRVRADGNVTIHRKTLADGTLVIALLNRVNAHGKTTFTATDLGTNGNFQMRDLWMRQNLGIQNGSRTVYLKPCETRLLLVSPRI